MKFSTREDIAAPIEEVFGVISDFERMERAALRRGAEVTRNGGLDGDAPDMAWAIRFDFRGKTRVVKTELAEYTPPERMTFRSASSGLEGTGEVDLVALSPRQTRIAVAIELRPKTLSARMFLQTVKLAKGKVTDRFKSGIGRFAREIEAGRFQQRR